MILRKYKKFNESQTFAEQCAIKEDLGELGLGDKVLF